MSVMRILILQQKNSKIAQGTEPNQPVARYPTNPPPPSRTH